MKLHTRSSSEQRTMSPFCPGKSLHECPSARGTGGAPRRDALRVGHPSSRPPDDDRRSPHRYVLRGRLRRPPRRRASRCGAENGHEAPFSLQFRANGAPKSRSPEGPIVAEHEGDRRGARVPAELMARRPATQAKSGRDVRGTDRNETGDRWHRDGEPIRAAHGTAATRCRVGATSRRAARPTKRGSTTRRCALAMRRCRR